MVDLLRVATALDLDATDGELDWAIDGADHETALAIALAFEEKITALFERNAAILHRLRELAEQHPELAL